MKRTFLAIVAAFMMTMSANAQRLTDVMAEARFITDKMVVELGLSSVQRNNILNINLSYLNGINSYRDIDAYGWKHRNKQLRKMMSARQWKRFKEAGYFYRPIGWRNNEYVHNIYNRYPKGFNDRGPRPRPEEVFGNQRRPGKNDRVGRPGGPGRPDGPGKPDKHWKKHKHDR